MTLLDTEAFGFSTSVSDFNTYSVLTIGGGGSLNIFTGGPLGDNYASISGAGGSSNNAYCYFRFISSITTFFCGLRVNFSNSGVTNYQFLIFDANGTQQGYLQFNSLSGTVNFYRGTSTSSSGGSSTGQIPANGWFYLEVGGTINATTGSIQVRVNGNTVLNLTNINTQASSLATMARVAWCTPGFSSAAQLAHYYICDNGGSAPNNNFLGDLRVQTLSPTSNDVVQFAQNGLAQNYLNAAKIPPVPATDYNSDANLGDQDTFNIATPASALSTIYGVQVKSLIGKTDAGTRLAANVIKSSGTVVVGPTAGLSLSALLVRQIAATDPATGAAWTTAGLSAAKMGYKVVG